MPTIKETSVRNLKVADLHNCPTGRLLLVAVKESEPQVALRAQFPFGNGAENGLIFLEGQDAGRFCSDTFLEYPASLDVTDLVEVAITALAPRGVSARAILIGGIFKIQDRGEQILFGVAVNVLGAPSTSLFAKFQDGVLTGQIITGLRPVFLGMPAVRERIL